VRTTQVIPLDRVQDVSTRQNLVGQVLGYGSLLIDTAGQEQNQRIDYLPAPGQLREQVFELSDRFWRGADPGGPVGPHSAEHPQVACTRAGGEAGPASRNGCPRAPSHLEQTEGCSLGVAEDRESPARKVLRRHHLPRAGLGGALE